MTEQTYIVRDRNGEIIAADVNAKLAAHEILTWNNQQYRVVDCGIEGVDRFDIEIARTGSGEFRRLFGVWAATEDALWERVISAANGWNECTAVPSEAYAAEMNGQETENDDAH